MKAKLTLNVAISLLALATLITRPSTSAAQGTAFTYQGHLNDGGAPANGDFDLTFSLWDAVSGPTQVGGSLTNSATAVSNGWFTVTLDFGAGVFPGANRWLEIGVRTNGAGEFAALSPRQPITATPYALTAGNLTGTVASSQLTGTISANNIGAGTITTPMLAAGAVGSNQLAAGAVTTAALADGAVTGPKVATVFHWYVLPITNPTPANVNNFGSAVAAVGSDLVLIGEPYAQKGAVYPGAAYLFSINGTLLTTFPNPTPADFDEFGSAVAGVGSDRVLIGAYSDNTGAVNAGAAYLFSTNGTLLTTFTNPTPVAGDYFGYSVAAVGSDRVLIGAYLDDAGATDAGAAYLFSTNGILLTTFTNPTPAAGDYFGRSVAAVGSDRVVIGALGADTGATDAGAAYLFSTNGTLLTTFTNPTPAAGDRFGSTVAAVESDRVLIGTPYDDTGAANAGAAYLFGTNGTLLTTFTNPTHEASDNFGYSVAAVGSDRVVIGAPFNNTGALQAGVAYLFTLESYVPGLVAEAVRFGGVTSASIAVGAVTSVLLAAGAVGSNQLAAGSVTTAALAARAVTSQQLAAGAVGANQLATGAVTTAALAGGAVTADKVATVTAYPLRITFTNPTPAVADGFGYAVAPVGTDRVLIGEPFDNSGATSAETAYLVSTNGTLLTTFTNPTPPTPAASDYFGYTVAAVGSDRVLIGAPGHDTFAGTAYLFSTNGTLLTTFTNPAPAANASFGRSLAAMGTDRVLIGAHGDDMGAEDAGAAYLFSTNGTLLTTFTNPTPAASDYFGYTVAAVGNDRVLMGAPWHDTGATDAGAAYLFSTNGTLLTTFTKPTPVANDWFGISVAAVGSDRVLIAALYDDTGGIDSGAAYLFSTNGILLTTFTNPTPAAGDYFGYSVAAVGSDRVLIGAPLNFTGAAAGAAYLFGTNGALLTTFTNSTLVANEFGYSVAAVGNDRVLIGAPSSSQSSAGAAYLFSTNGPETFAPGLVAEAVKSSSVTTDSLADGAVTAAKLDPTIGVWTRAGEDVFRLTGHVGIGTSTFTSNRLEVAGMVGATAFNSTSDCAAKQDFTPVDVQAVLAKVAALPITQWSFKEFSGARHLGPMAQDFYAAFGVGLDDKHIATVDADGVALAAIQGLNQKVEDLNRELKRRKTENAELTARLERLEQLLNARNGGGK